MIIARSLTNIVGHITVIGCMGVGVYTHDVFPLVMAVLLQGSIHALALDALREG